MGRRGTPRSRVCVTWASYLTSLSLFQEFKERECTRKCLPPWESVNILLWCSVPGTSLAVSVKVDTPIRPSPTGPPLPTLRSSRLGDRKASCRLMSPSAAPPWGNGSRGGSSLVQEGVCLREERLEGKGEVSSHGPDRRAGAGTSSGLHRHA